MSFPVGEIKIQELHRRMAQLGIREADIEERFIRSRGKGGQNVNKTATCVYLRHRPTGIEVKCQQERSQSLNRFFARRLLVGKIEQRVKGAASAAEQRREKIRRQKRRRSRRAKEKMLAAKKHRGEVKQLRGRVISE